MLRHFCLLFVILSGSAYADWDNSLLIEAGNREYFEDSNVNGQDYTSLSSIVMEPGVEWQNYDDGTECRLLARMKQTSVNDVGEYNVLKEAYCNYTTLDYMVLMGVNTEFWGVAESFNIVNVLNQLNLKEGFDTDERIGVFMLKGAYITMSGELSYYYLPRPDRVDYPSGENRWSYVPDGLEITSAQYDGSATKKTGIHILRYRGSFDAWEYAMYGYSGISRDAVLKPTSVPYVMQPHYYRMKQYGAELQYTGEGLLLKLESIRQIHDNDDFIGIVTGFEKSIYQPFGGAYEMSLVYEYLYDDRGRGSPVTLFENDHFVGFRMNDSDVGNFSVLLGVAYDINSTEKVAKLELESRIGGGLTLKVDSGYVWSESGILRHLDNDRYAQLTLKYYF